MCAKSEQEYGNDEASCWLRVGAFEPRSRANGPGVRAVIWVQGCDRRCPGCCNPELLDFAGGVPRTIESILGDIYASGPLDGIALSGGEPFEQAKPLVKLCKRMRAPDMTVVCFTGYTLDELQTGNDPAWTELLKHIDLLIAGPYIHEIPCEDPLRGSSNQQLHFLSGRIAREDLDGIPRVEIIVEDGHVRITGLDPDVSSALNGASDEGSVD